MSAELVSRTDSSKESDRLLVFGLNKEEYAIPLRMVKEVIALTEITPIPYSPPYFRGIMNLREQVISVVDLRLKFGMTFADKMSDTSIIILDLAPISIGVVVDTIDSVMEIDRSQVAPPPDLKSQVDTKYITGVVRKDKRLILLLDIGQTLNVADLKAVHDRHLKLVA